MSTRNSSNEYACHGRNRQMALISLLGLQMETVYKMMTPVIIMQATFAKTIQCPAISCSLSKTQRNKAVLHTVQYSR